MKKFKSNNYVYVTFTGYSAIKNYKWHLLFFIGVKTLTFQNNAGQVNLYFTGNDGFWFTSVFLLLVLVFLYFFL